jgi:hypothetical protein
MILTYRGDSIAIACPAIVEQRTELESGGTLVTWFITGKLTVKAEEPNV